MTRHVRTAIIGGGIVGCAVLYGLAKRGWTDTVLLERRQLTSGSTWHAAGNTTYFGPYPAMTRLFTNSIATYLRAEAESGQSVGFHQTGSLRLATLPSEVTAFQALSDDFAGMGIPYDLVTPERAQELFPLLNPAGILAAGHTPTDGHVDASGATHAMAKAARDLGAKIHTQSPVSTIEQTPKGWRLTTRDKVIEAENIVLAASFWARELAQQIGLNLPLYAIQHHEIITGPAAELAEINHELPTLRDPDAPANIRQESNGFLTGVYEKGPKFWGVDGIPPDFSEELFPPELDRLMPELSRVIARVPAFGRAEVKAVNNGPICYTPDGVPLLGPVPEKPGLWLATGFTIGIGTGGGAGQFLAHWMTTGEPEFDLPVVHPARFSNNIARDAALAQITATYEKGYRLT